jgi:hypothetical protein
MSGTFLEAALMHYTELEYKSVIFNDAKRKRASRKVPSFDGLVEMCYDQALVRAVDLEEKTCRVDSSGGMGPWRLDAGPVTAFWWP